MGDRFQLYAGIVKDDKWYNFTEVEEIKGGVLAVMAGEDKSPPAKLLNMVKGAVKTVYTESGEPYTMKDYDYEDLVFEDGYKIGLHVMQQFTGEQYPVISEYFYCPRCSTIGDERYTEVRESWLKLVEKGLIDEHYLTDPAQMQFKTTLPHGLDIDQPGMVEKGTYTVLYRHFLTIKEAIKVANMRLKAEADHVYAIWDQQITSIDGLSDKAINALLKRKTADSFSKKYFLKQEDLDAMRDQTPKIGLDADERSIQCSYCHSEIGGRLDQTNFFEFLSSKKQHRSSSLSPGMAG